MENQKELLELLIQYIQENQQVIRKLGEMVNENDRTVARRLTTRNDRLLEKIEQILPPQKPIYPNI